MEQVSRQCTICQKAYGQTSHQLMGQLPPLHLQPAPSFDRGGVHFAGPLTTVRGNPRRPTRLKTHICVFVCVATKAIHLEICTDLSKDTFMASFRRFCSRRGHPSQAYSDNGTNSLGFSRELSEVQSLLRSKDTINSISHLSSSKGITWNFILARTPQMWRLWEVAVRALKLQLKKVVGTHVLTHEQLATVIAEVGAILNSRPLIPVAQLSTHQSISFFGRPLLAPGEAEAQTGGVIKAQRVLVTAPRLKNCQTVTCTHLLACS